MFEAFAERQSVEHVARKCGVHHATARRYRLADRWDERLAEIRARAQREADYGIADAMRESLRIVRVYKQKLAAAIDRKRLGNGDVSVTDLERVVRLEAFVLGAAESRHEVLTEFSAWSDEEVERFAVTGELPAAASGRAR